MLMRRNRKLIVARRGAQYITLRLSEVAFFTTSDKLVYAVIGAGRKYLVSQKLQELEEQLDTNIFFRVNRQYIVNVFFIKAFKPYKKVQLFLELEVENLRDEIVVSQLATPAFREWINNI